jgi:2-dehydro-3-deoxygluconokinase
VSIRQLPIILAEGYAMKAFDVVTCGENMIRLSTRNYERFTQAQTLDIRHGGTESNVAVGLARLGFKTAWVSRLADNVLGHKIADELSAWGVDTSRIVWTNDGRIGVFFLEVGTPPRASTILYDRRNSTMSQMSAADFPWDVLSDARWLHLTGITAALGDSCYQLVATAMARAHDAGLAVSFDVNYRARLWTPEQAKTAIEPLCRDADVLFVTLADAARVLGVANANREDGLRALAERLARKVIVLTLGAEGAAAIDKTSDKIYRIAAIPVAHTIDRVGAGDAFAAGFIAGYLEDGIEKGLRFGAAMASLKMTIHGDQALVTRAEVEALVAGAVGGISR